MLTDELARRQALDPRHSFIVQAPAGSGKTSLLVRRFLKLLTTVTRPEAVVAMTFTRKAASEMKERILKELAAAESELAREVLARDEEMQWGLLRDSGRLQIQTIDALCAMLVRQMPLVSEAGGIGEVVEDASEFYHLAVRRVLQTLTESSQEFKDLFIRVSLFFDNDVASLENKVVSLLEKREQWLHYSLDSHSPVVDDFRTVLHLAHSELRNVFRQHGVVDFTEITRFAIRALGDPEQPSDLLYSLDYRIQHVLVDEFQDTSKAQYSLLEALVGQWSEDDGRTLFVVGDPTQSIYRFRAAEVSLFLDAWRAERLGGVHLRPLRLTTNFRSTPEIVTWVNDTLGPLMPADNSDEGAVQLQPAHPNRNALGSGPQMIPLLGDDGTEEARRVVEIVERERRQGSVAILVRSRAHVGRILPLLRSADIRYEAVDIDPLRDQQHVLDALSLARAMLHLADRVSWLACLRAPWCGLTLADLSALVEGEPSRTVWSLLSDASAVHSLSVDGRERAIRFVEAISLAMRGVGRERVRSVVEHAWFALGGPSLLAGPHQRQDVDTLFGLLERFDEGGTIRDFGLLSERIELLYARPDIGDDCIRVMTIHTAKGLEFDTVILPQLERQTRLGETELLLSVERPDQSVRIAAQSQRGEEQNLEYQSIKDEIATRERHEDHRLLYVACTRAANRLYLLGTVRPKAGGTDVCVPRSGTFLRMLWTRYQTEYQSLVRRQVPAQASLFLVQDQRRRTQLRRAPLSWQAPIPSPSVDWRPELKRDIASARRITYEWVGSTGRHVGTVVHGMLKRISQEGLSGWSTTRIGSLRPLFTGELKRLGVSGADLPEAVQQVVVALQNTLESERGRWILSVHPSAASEIAVQGRVGERLVAGTIDRMIRSGDGDLWILDYKTSQHQGGNLQRFLDEEVRRYREQMESYAALISRLESGPIHLGLYFPLLNSWRSWMYSQAELPAAAMSALDSDPA